MTVSERIRSDAGFFADALMPGPYQCFLCDAEEMIGEDGLCDDCRAKIRYRHREQDALAYPLPGGGVRLVFDEPQRAVTPGQAAVLYDGDTVLGGGMIGQETDR